METPHANAPRRTTTNYADATDEQLVVAALLSDLRAFDELTQRYRAAVIATAMQFVRDRAAAEDLAQEIFLMAFYALPQLDEPARFGGWLRVVTQRQARRFAAKEKIKRGGDLPLLEEFLNAPRASQDGEPEAAFVQQEEKETIWEALEMVSPDQREILLLYAYEDWPLAHIAEYLAINEGAARVRLFRAREALRRIWAVLNGETSELPTKTKTQKPKGKQDNGRTSEGRTTERGTAPNASASQADVQDRRTRQPDRSVQRGSGGNHGTLQLDSPASASPRRRNGRAFHATAGGCLA